MKIERGEVDGVIVLRVRGEIDFSDTHQLLADLRELAAEAPRQVLVNLSECTGLASTAIGIFVGWRCESSLHGRNFWILCPSPEVREIFDMVGVTEQLVRPEKTQADAIANMQAELTRHKNAAHSAADFR